MDVAEETCGRVVVVTAHGRLDASASPVFGSRLDQLANAAEPRLLIDFSGIDFVSSAGLRVIAAALKKVKAANGVFALCGVRAPVQEVLDITGFTNMLQIHPERTAALAALS